MKILIRLTQVLALVALTVAISLPSTAAAAKKKSSKQNSLWKAYENCLLDGGKTSIPANGKGATCCGVIWCTTCDGSTGVCKQKANFLEKEKKEKPKAVDSSTGTMQETVEKKPLKDSMQQKSLESKEVIAPSAPAEKKPIKDSMKQKLMKSKQDSAPSSQ